MKKSTMLIIIAVVVAGALAYFFFLGGETINQSALQAESNPEIQASAARVLSLLNQIRSLKIDTSIFSSPEYQTLRDYTVTIPPVDVGRINPFAPTSVRTTVPRTTTPRR